MSQLAITVENQARSLYDSLRSKFADGKLSGMEGYLLGMELVGGIGQIHARLIAEGQPIDAIRVACHAAIDKFVVPLIHQGFDVAFERIVAGAKTVDADVIVKE